MDDLDRTIEGVRRLVLQAKAGDGQAVARLLGMHEPMMLRFAKKRLGTSLRSLDDTRDILQDAYQIVLRRIGSFEMEDSRSFARWLRGIITRVVLRKAGAPYVIRRAALPENREPQDLELTPMTRLSLEELRRWRYRFLRECERMDRLIYRLRMRGCGAAEIAARLGVTDRAVRMRFAKTDARLRLKMKNLVEANPRG